MKERPILFSSAMIRALLAGTKTQTRRICKLASLRPSDIDGCDWQRQERNGDWRHYTTAQLIDFHCPYGGPGSRLWVREAWRTWERPDDLVDGIRYRADDSFRRIENTPEAAERWVDLHRNGLHGERWRPAIHMPRWASRITLEVTGVRVERLHEIDELDALAEGVEGRAVEGVLNGVPGKYITGSARDAFADLWREINGAESWDASPFVWVVEFKRVVQSHDVEREVRRHL